MSKVSKIINTANWDECLESGIILGPYDVEGSVRENIELTDRERERLARWCVIVEIGDERTEPELQLAINALIRAEAERMYRGTVEADCYWADQTVSAEVHDFVGEDRVRPRLVVTSNPDYSGGSKQFSVDVVASIRHDWKNIACPLIDPVIKRWQSYVRLFRHTKLHHTGREMYGIATELLRRTVPTALETAQTQALPKEIAFQTLLNRGASGGFLLVDGSYVDQELGSLRFAWAFISDENFKAIKRNNWASEWKARFKALKEDLETHKDFYASVQTMGKSYVSLPSKEDLSKAWELVNERVLFFFQENFNQYSKAQSSSSGDRVCWLFDPPQTFEKLESQYLQWRFESNGADLRSDTVEKYLREARRLYEENHGANDLRLRNIDATLLANRFSLEQRVPCVHHAGTELHFQFEKGKPDRTTLLLNFNPRTE